MALLTCKDCKKELSSDAKRCPHCGAKPKRTSPIVKFFLWFILICSLPGILSILFDNPQPQPKLDTARTELNKPPVQTAEVINWPERPDMPSFDKEAALTAYFENSKNLKPRIIGYTNLPEDMEMMVSLYRKDIKYSASADATVHSGKFITEPFSALGSNLPPGNYIIKITSPLPDLEPPAVKAILGNKGNKLKGKLANMMYGERMVNYSANVKLGDGISKSAETEYYKNLENDEKQKKASLEAKIPTAQYACKQFVSQQLHDPDSAEFEPTANYPAKIDGGIYKIQVSVRARNGFNAIRRAVFDCEIMPMQQDRWLPVKIKQIGF